VVCTIHWVCLVATGFFSVFSGCTHGPSAREKEIASYEGDGIFYSPIQVKYDLLLVPEFEMAKDFEHSYRVSNLPATNGVISGYLMLGIRDPGLFISKGGLSAGETDTFLDSRIRVAVRDQLSGEVLKVIEGSLSQFALIEDPHGPDFYYFSFSKDGLPLGKCELHPHRSYDISLQYRAVEPAPRELSGWLLLRVYWD